MGDPIKEAFLRLARGYGAQLGLNVVSLLFLAPIEQ
jgi:hypothetical protein